MSIKRNGKPPYRALVVGGGYSGLGYHLPAFNAIDRVSVCGVVDPLPEARSRIRASFPAVQTFGSIAEAMSALKPDIVSIATPPKFHANNVNELSSSVATILVEKPIAIDLATAEAMAVAAQNFDAQIIPIHNKLAWPGIRAGIRAVERGDVGEIRHIEAFWMVSWKKNSMTANRSHWSHQLVGGRFSELIPHQIYIMQKLDPTLKLAHVSTKKMSPQPEWLRFDSAHIVLEGEVSATITLSVQTPRSRNYFRVIGTKADVVFDAGSAIIQTRQKDILFEPNILRNSRRARNKVKKSDRRLKAVSKHLPFFFESIGALQGANVPATWREGMLALELSNDIAAAMQCR